MTTINGLAVSEELASFLKGLCATNIRDDSQLTCYIDNLTNIQDYLSRNLSQLPDVDLQEITSFFETIVFIKDDLKKLLKLLPVIEIS